MVLWAKFAFEVHTWVFEKNARFYLGSKLVFTFCIPSPEVPSSCY
jgi:hypothetical protein